MVGWPLNVTPIRTLTAKNFERQNCFVPSRGSTKAQKSDHLAPSKEGGGVKLSLVRFGCEGERERERERERES